MNNTIKELINSFTEEDFLNNKVNLHIHTQYSDGKANFNNIIEQAKVKGYKKIAICDHNTIQGYLDTDVTNENIIIPGVEFDCWLGYVFFHLLAYGIDVKSEELKPFLAKSKKETELDCVRIFAKRDVEKLIEAIHNAGGIAVLAHPACCWALSLERFVKRLINLGLDGIEVYYPYARHRAIIKFKTINRVKEIANKLNLIKTGGTDLHTENLI
jgi:predicted metal-dependent phosphoesterase TrpH